MRIIYVYWEKYINMKKVIIIFLTISTIIILLNKEIHAYKSDNFDSGYSDYWNSSAGIGDYTHIGHTYFKGSWWDGLVLNSSWTYIDYLFSNHYTATFETLLTSPTLKADFIVSLILGYKYTQTFIKQSKTSIYGYLILEDGYQIDSDLFSLYQTNVTTHGTEVEVPVNMHPNGDSYPSKFEYSIGLYKIELSLKQRKVYRYEIGSWWSKTIREEIETKDETVTVAYVAIPVRVDEEFNTSNYFYSNSGIDRKIIG